MGKNGVKTLIIILVILILAAGGILAYKITKDKKNISQEVSEDQSGDNILTAGVNEKKVKIFNGEDRPIAVMIDNHSQAWPQAGLNKAYLEHAVLVEG